MHKSLLVFLVLVIGIVSASAQTNARTWELKSSYELQYSQPRLRFLDFDPFQRDRGLNLYFSGYRRDPFYRISAFDRPSLYKERFGIGFQSERMELSFSTGKVEDRGNVTSAGFSIRW